MNKTRSAKFKKEIVKQVIEYVDNLEEFGGMSINLFTLTDISTSGRSFCSVSILEPRLSEEDVLHIKKQEDLIIRFLFIIEKRKKEITNIEQKLQSKIIDYERYKSMIKDEPNNIFGSMRINEKIIYKKKLGKKNQRLMTQIHNLNKTITKKNQQNLTLKNKIELKKASILSVTGVVDIWHMHSS